MRPKVDFLGIGAQKSATTWLDVNLRKHPDIWMPPIKELHYFDRSPEYSSQSHLSKKSPLKSYLSRKLKRENRFSTLKNLTRSIINDPASALWLCKYFYLKPNDSWYLSLFEHGGNKIKGEITPDYSMLNDKDVYKVHELLPDLKIIFLIRNPIYRCWSQIRFYWSKNPNFNTKNLKKFIDSPQQTLRSDYTRTMDLWTNYFPKEQFFIGYYDDVENNPEKLFTDILNFLGTDRILITNSINEKVHVSKKYEMPNEIKKYLAKKYQPLIKELAETIGGPTITWLKEAEEILTKV